MYGQPRYEIAELRHQLAIETRDQCEDPVQRKSRFQYCADVPGREELRDLPMGRLEFAFRHTYKQPGTQHLPRQVLRIAFDVRQGRIVTIRLRPVR